MTARWALVTAASGAVRGRLLRDAIAALTRAGLRVSGVLQEPVFTNDERVGERIVRMTNSERLPIARVASAASEPSEVLFCGRVFDNETFRRAREWLALDAASADVLVLDDVSKLEVSGGGHSEALREALARDGVLVLSIRGDQLFAALEKFALVDPIAALDDDTATDADAFALAIVSAVRGNVP